MNRKVNTILCPTDIVFDVYRPSSLEAEARSKLGHGARRRVTSKCKVPSNWRNFLRDNDNKTDLFNFLADKIEQMTSPNNYGDRDQRRECRPTQQPYDQPRRRVPVQSRGSRHTYLCTCQACRTGGQCGLHSVKTGMWGGFLHMSCIALLDLRKAEELHSFMPSLVVMLSHSSVVKERNLHDRPGTCVLRLLMFLLDSASTHQL